MEIFTDGCVMPDGRAVQDVGYGLVTMTLKNCAIPVLEPDMTGPRAEILAVKYALRSSVGDPA